MVETVETSITEGQTLEPGKVEEDLEGLRVGIDFPEAGKQESLNRSSQVVGKDRKDDKHNLKDQHNLRLQQNNLKTNVKALVLRSYVYPEDAISTIEQDPRFVEKRTKVAELGVEKVMQHEREEGRIPKDMEKVQVHHPGYDVESRTKDGEIRYIEVKSLSGIWDSQNPAEVTKTEFEAAEKRGENYWLYVVEHAANENFKIHTIKIQQIAYSIICLIMDGFSIWINNENNIENCFHFKSNGFFHLLHTHPKY